MYVSITLTFKANEQMKRAGLMKKGYELAIILSTKPWYASMKIKHFYIT